MSKIEFTPAPRPFYGQDDHRFVSTADVIIPRAQYEALMGAAKVLPKLFKAVDLLMAQLIAADRAFMPTKSPAWPPITETNRAIAALRSAGIEEMKTS